MEHLTLWEKMGKIEEIMNSNPEPIKNTKASYQFTITDADPSTYQLHIELGSAKILSKDLDETVDCTLKTSKASFEKFLAGKLSGTTAFMTGKLKINGDMTKALKLEALLKHYRG